MLRNAPRALLTRVLSTRRRFIAAGIVHSSLEIERKFECTPAILAKLFAAALSTTTLRMTDVYFDSPSFVLGRNDFWLRRRNDGWELKSPSPAGCIVPMDSRIDCYVERDDPGDISRFLDRTFSPEDTTSQSAGAARDPLNELRRVLTRLSLTPFATIFTARTRLYLNDPVACNVDIDQVRFSETESSQERAALSATPSHGFAASTAATCLETRGQYVVGEVELVLSPDGTPRHAAPRTAPMPVNEAMALVFEKFGISDTGAPCGKVFECIRRHRNAHWLALVDCGLVARKLGHAPPSL